MIYYIHPISDAYVNNMNLVSNKGIDSNTGKSSTLDLFKLYNENKEAFSKAFLKVDENIVNNETFQLIDFYNTKKTFIFKTGEAFLENALEGENIKIGFSDLIPGAPENYASRIKDAINAIDDLKITAYANSNNELILMQDEKGIKGDTDFTLPNSGITNKTLNNSFSRTEFSAILVKFDIESFKESINIQNLATSLFNEVKVILNLKDVTTGLSKPKNYTISAYRLLKDFDEGLGSDVIYFSDKDTANFIKLTNNVSWEIPGFISKGIDVSENAIDTQNIIEGDENLSINITSYYNDVINQVVENKGILITFSDDYIYNDKSYFVKRFGSRHLLNLSLRPEIVLLANDESFKVNMQKENVYRFFNATEHFYLINDFNGRFKDFYIPNNFTLKAKIVKKTDNTIVFVENLLNIENVYSLDGSVKLGVKKGILNEDQLDFYSSSVQNNISNNMLKTELIWFIVNDNDENDTIEISRTDVTFSNSIRQLNSLNKHIVTSITSRENNLISNDMIYRFSVYFNDPELDNAPVKTPISLSSLDLGDVFYSIYNVDSGEEIVPYYDTEENKFATKAFYDGEKYVFDVQLNNKFKNKRINFKFKNKDTISDSYKILTNDKIALKVN